jgi:hypothetical protein
VNLLNSSQQDQLQLLDLQHARLSHLHWELSLDRPFSSLVGMLPDWPTAKECDLGRWFQKKGLSDFCDFISTKQIEEQHILFHSIADACYQAVQRDAPDEFERYSTVNLF